LETEGIKKAAAASVASKKLFIALILMVQWQGIACLINP
jgi:hypothetical protein